MKKSFLRFKPLLCQLLHSHADPCGGLEKFMGAFAEKMATNARDNFMTSITTAARIVILFAIALMFAVPFCPRSLALDDHNPVGVTGAFEGVSTTGCAYNVLNHSATRQIDDIVVPGAIGKYGLKMTRYYNSRSGFGDGWSYGLTWGTSTYDDKIYYANGTVVDSSCANDWGVGPLGVSDGWETHPSYGNGTYRLADGGTIVFQNHRSTSIIDPYGLTKTLTYDPNSGVLTRITEPGGRYLQFTYNASFLLTQVDAYDGRGNRIDYVVYHYTAIRPNGGGTIGTPVNCLTSVDYSDGTHAYYAYQDDNVPNQPNQPCPCSVKAFPLLRTCQDVRYNGAMRHICYEYQYQGPHGAIIAEKYSLNGSTNGPRVSGIDPPAPSPIVTDPSLETTYTETRGDGNITRRFNYTSLHIHRHDGEICPSWSANLDPAPQQFLRNYTDFQGHTTYLGYDPNWYVNSVRDANNHTTSYTRGPPPNAYPGPKGTGQILRITHPGGNHIDYTYYDESGNISGHYLQQITNERGAVAYHFRDGNHRITRTDYKDANGNLLANETFSYNSFGQVLTHRLKNLAWESFVYDGRGLLTDKYNPKLTGVPGGGDPHIHYSYYTSGPWTDRVQTMTLPANVSTNVASETYEYDRGFDGNGVTNLNAGPVAGRGLVTKITHADGKYRRFKYDWYGNKAWEDNELRKTTSYSYDEYNRPTSTTDPLQNADSISYLKPGTSSSYLHTTNSIYTYTSRAGIVTTNGYDENWRKTSTVAASGTLNLSTGFAYDPVGNLTDVTDPRFKVTHHVYDNRNRKTSTTEAYNTSLAATTVWHYDPASNINQIDPPNGGHQETKGYDALNRMIWHTVSRQVPGGNPINLTTHIYYNPSGTIDHVTDARAKVTSFQYNASDEKTQMTYHDGSYQQWSWDNAHNLATRRTVRGAPEIQRFDYDSCNRKTDMHWDNSVDSAHYTYYADGRLNTASNPNSTVTRQYDDAGHLTLDQQNVIGLGIRSVNYPPYDDDGRLKGVSVTNASYDYTYTYDSAGRFSKIFASTNLNNALFEYQYDPASNETHRYTYLPNNVPIDQVYARDSLNRISSRLVKKNGATFSTEAYTYDHMNRITEVNGGGSADSFAFYWDGELMSATYGGGPHFPYTEGQEPDLDTTR